MPFSARRSSPLRPALVRGLRRSSQRWRLQFSLLWPFLQSGPIYWPLMKNLAVLLATLTMISRSKRGDERSLLEDIHILSSTLLFGTGLGRRFTALLLSGRNIPCGGARGRSVRWPTGYSRLRQS